MLRDITSVKNRRSYWKLFREHLFQEKNEPNGGMGRELERRGAPFKHLQLTIWEHLT